MTVFDEIRRILKKHKDIMPVVAVAEILADIDGAEAKWDDGQIPCSERLPEKAGKYLVTINSGGDVHTTVRRFNPKPKHPEQNEPLFTKHLPFYSGWERRTCGVIAWKDLPIPYQKGE